MLRRPIFALFMLSSSAFAFAQTPSEQSATVVFFTPGSHWRGTGSQLKALAFGKADVMSVGGVFDGNDFLSFLSHSRYISFRFPAGPHSFSTSLNRRHPNPKEVLALDLTPGTTTYVAVTTTMTNYGAGIYSTMTSHIASATCEEFVDANSDHPLEEVEEKHVAKPMLLRLMHEAIPTHCTP